MRYGLFALLISGCATQQAAVKAPELPLQIRVTLSSTVTPEPISGRLIVMMSTVAPGRAVLDFDYGDPKKVWLAAMDVAGLAPGSTIAFDADRLAFPAPFSRAPRGSHHFMALLDRDGSYISGGTGAQDLVGRVIERPTGPVELVLDRVIPESSRALPPNAQIVEIPSPLLSAFRGRETTQRVVVILPPGTGPWPTVYAIPGFGGALDRAGRYASLAARGVLPAMAYVVLLPQLRVGHHALVDSVNNGPYGRAFVEEMIPALEARFPLIAAPRARFLTGHSSGGWASLWTMIQHPDLFAGTWSTAPDPVDFRSFTGVDVTPGSKENVYRDAKGQPRNLFRMNGAPLLGLEEFARLEDAMGEYGGALSTFDWAFSPRGPTGRPQWLWDRATGVVDPAVAEAWTRFDIRRVLAERWGELGPKLRGKLFIQVGAEDSFHLEEGVGHLCAFLAEKQSDAACTIVPGKDHFNLRDEALEREIGQQMKAKFDRK